MKIAFLTEYSDIGGGESNLMNLAERLNHDHEITLFCSGRVYSEAKKRNIRVKKFTSKRRWFKFFPLISFNNKMIGELNKYDIVHSYSLNCIPTLYFVKTKKIWTTHGYWENAKGLRALIINKIIDNTICVSTDVYNSTELVKKEKIYLGTNFELSTNVKKNKLDTKNISLACIGRFQEIKGQDLLVNALSMISDQDISFDKLTLHFIGDVNGNDENDIAFKNKVVELAESLKNTKIEIIFNGFQNNVRSFIENSDIVIIPSRYESFSMVAIEALSCGRPVIAPKIAGPKDIVNSEEIGQLFMPGDIQSLKEKIIFSLKNYSVFSIKKCIERASFFSIKNQANNHIELYKRVIND